MSGVGIESGQIFYNETFWLVEFTSKCFDMWTRLYGLYLTSNN